MGRAFQGQVAVLGSLAAVAVTSLIIATMAMTSGMIGLAGVAFAFYSVAVALQWCLPALGAAVPVQALAFPVALCTWLAYRRHQDHRTDGPFPGDQERAVTPYRPRRTIPSSQTGMTSTQVDVPRAALSPRGLSVPQQRAYLQHLFLLPPARRPQKGDGTPLHRALGWMQDGLFGRSHFDAEGGPALHETADVRRVKRALQRMYELHAGPDVPSGERLGSEEREESVLRRPFSTVELAEARAALQRLYETPDGPV